MKTLFVVPAYGHRYKDRIDLLKGWYKGKDFRILGMGPYLSIRDEIPNTEIYAVSWDEKFKYGKVLLPQAEIEDIEECPEDEDDDVEDGQDDYDPPDDYFVDNPADDYIMTERELRELRGEL